MLVLHAMVRGETHDIPVEDLNLPVGASDETVLNALADRLDVERGSFEGHIVVHEADGNLTVRPEAKFGS